MKETHQFLVTLLVALSLAAILGCSPSSDPENARRDSDLQKKNIVSENSTNLDSEFGELSKLLDEGNGRSISKGKTICEKIALTSDKMERAKWLEKFRSTLLSFRPEGSDYQKLCNQLHSIEELHFLFLCSLFRCGGDLETSMTSRLDFLKWLKRERSRQSTIKPEDERKLSGLHITAEAYLTTLDQTYNRNLRWLEENFNDHVAKELPSEVAARIKEEVEMFIGRRIRSSADILRDRMMRKSSKPFSAQKDIKVPIDI